MILVIICRWRARVTGYHGGASKSLMGLHKSIAKAEAVYLLFGAEYIPKWWGMRVVGHIALLTTPKRGGYMCSSLSIVGGPARTRRG